MADMRDFSPSNDIRAESAFVDSDEVEIKESYTLDDSGGLGEFHRPAAAENSSRGPILGALAVALMIGAAGAVVYTMYGPQPEMVADGSLPRTSAPDPASVTPMAPPPPADAAMGDGMAMAPSDTAMSTPASTPTRAQTAMSPPAAPDMAPRPAQQRVANAPARVAAPPPPVAMTPAPAPAAPSPETIAPPAVTPSQQASTVPEPVSPTPPASAIAGNPPLNEQSATPEEAAPVTPTVPESAPAEPAPAASLDQSQ